MISLAPFAISQRLQPPDKLLVSVRGNGIQSPGEALSVSRSLSQIRQQGEPQLARGAAAALKKKRRSFNWLVYLLIEGGGADGRQFQSLVCAHTFLLPHTRCLKTLHSIIFPSPLLMSKKEDGTSQHPSPCCCRCDPSDAGWLCLAVLFLLGRWTRHRVCVYITQGTSGVY